MRKEKLRKKQCLIIAMSILTVPFNNIHHVQATETDQQYRNLEKLCLVWGYTKYRHPVFLSGQKDWDEELLNLIDPVSEASNDDEVNEILYEWFEELGDTDYGTDFYDLSWENADENDKLFLADTTWRDDPEYLGEDLSSALMEIDEVPTIYRGNAPMFITRDQISIASFDNEKVLDDFDFSDKADRLLGLFRMWNVIEYYYPYLNILDKEWIEILDEMIPIMLEGDDEHSYCMAMEHFTAQLHDAHALYGYAGVLEEYGEYSAPVRLIQAEGKYVVNLVYKDCDLQVGDVIVAFNGRPIEDIIEEQKQYISITEDDKILNQMEGFLLRAKESDMDITVRRGDDEISVTTQGMSLEENQTVKGEEKESYEVLDNNIGLMNPSVLTDDEFSDIMKKVKETNGLIIDLRQYPKIGNWINTLAEYLKAEETPFCRAIYNSPTIPGAYLTNYVETSGGKQVPYHYEKPVVILMNERTQSLAEYTIMMFRDADNTVVMGSNSVGSDGNLAYLYAPEGNILQFSGIGILTAEGEQTQRIGLSPDIYVEPTIAGIREGRDELIEAAIQYIEKKSN